jgi:hypothetical protein
MQRKSKPLHRLLLVLMGSTLLGASAVAVSQTEPIDPNAPSVSEPIATDPMTPEQAALVPNATEPASTEPTAAEPAPTGEPVPLSEPVTAQPEPIAPPYNVNPNVSPNGVQAAPPAASPGPEAITVTVQYNEGDYQRVFEDMDANRNGIISASEMRTGALPGAVVSRISHERQMARTDGTNEGGYNTPVTPALR